MNPNTIIKFTVEGDYDKEVFSDFFELAERIASKENNKTELEFIVADPKDTWRQTDLVGEFLSDHFVTLSTLGIANQEIVLVPSYSEFSKEILLEPNVLGLAAGLGFIISIPHPTEP